LEKTILRKTWKTLVQVKEFLPYYEKAKAVLAKRCMNGTMEKSFGHRYIRLYDSELRNDENELLKLKAELAKAQDKEEVAENVIRKLAQVVKAAEEKENGDG
jgi:protein-disulfide isomerase